MTADEQGLVRLDFDRRNVEKTSLKKAEISEAMPCEEHRVLPEISDWAHNPLWAETKHWLDLYFAGAIPDFTPPLHLMGSPFQLSVWNVLTGIPYGALMTYGEIAKVIAKQSGKEKMSAQAVGGAVGKNPVGIIVPCHRVVGGNGKLTGFGGGMDRKIALLEIEGWKIDEDKLRLCADNAR